MDFFYAWTFLSNHPTVKGENGDSYFRSCLDIYVEKVNPETGKTDDEVAKNTQTEVWLEFGPWQNRSEMDAYMQSLCRYEGSPTHDPYLDCEVPTFEAAICMLAVRVNVCYGRDAKEHRLDASGQPVDPGDRRKIWRSLGIIE